MLNKDFNTDFEKKLKKELKIMEQYNLPFIPKIKQSTNKSQAIRKMDNKIYNWQ